MFAKILVSTARQSKFKTTEVEITEASNDPWQFAEVDASASNFDGATLLEMCPEVCPPMLHQLDNRLTDLRLVSANGSQKNDCPASAATATPHQHWTTIGHRIVSRDQFAFPSSAYLPSQSMLKSQVAGVGKHGVD